MMLSDVSQKSSRCGGCLSIRSKITPPHNKYCSNDKCRMEKKNPENHLPFSLFFLFIPFHFNVSFTILSVHSFFYFFILNSPCFFSFFLFFLQPFLSFFLSFFSPICLSLNILSLILSFFILPSFISSVLFLILSLFLRLLSVSNGNGSSNSDAQI